MYSYRHGFHAGNHADVLKHLCLIATARYLMRKPTPLLMVDTHAGAGLYRLDGDYAQTSGEAQEGVLRLVEVISPSNQAPDRTKPALEATDSEANLLTDYLNLVGSFNTGPRWRVYPGSPMLMFRLMDEPARAAIHDRLKLFEMHPSDAQALHGHVAQLEAGRRVSATRSDGFAGLKSLLPPPAGPGGSRRALVLIDPSYEIKSDYAKVAAAIEDSLVRFATGVYLVWYPIVPRPEAHDLPRRLRTVAQQAGRSWVHATLAVGSPADARSSVGAAAGAPQRRGLTASGMFVINPPHLLGGTLEATLPRVLDALGQGTGQGWSVDQGG